MVWQQVLFSLGYGLCNFIAPTAGPYKINSDILIQVIYWVND